MMKKQAVEKKMNSSEATAVTTNDRLFSGAVDRVWFSEGLKINLGNYQSYDVGAGMTTDVREGETPEQAYARCRKATRAQLESRAAKVQRGMYDHLLNTPSESE